VLSESLDLRLGQEKTYQASLEKSVAATRAGLPAATFTALWGEGRAMTLEQAIEYALAKAPSQADPRGRRRRGGTMADSLTAREREVAMLVARGLSNREIASRLVITKRTAEGHIQGIFTKLGFNARSQIAAWAVEQGLRGVT
jgi:non-specific serine/threonine protein kinase